MTHIRGIRDYLLCQTFLEHREHIVAVKAHIKTKVIKNSCKIGHLSSDCLSKKKPLIFRSSMLKEVKSFNFLREMPVLEKVSIEHKQRSRWNSLNGISTSSSSKRKCNSTQIQAFFWLHGLVQNLKSQAYYSQCEKHSPESKDSSKTEELPFSVNTNCSYQWSKSSNDNAVPVITLVERTQCNTIKTNHKSTLEAISHFVQLNSGCRSVSWTNKK